MRMERVQASRGSEAIKHFPLQKREGGDSNGSHQGRMCCYLATQTIANRHCVCVCVCVCVSVCVCLSVNGTPASVALPREIVNCCGQATMGLRVRGSPKTIYTRVILRISADKCTIKTFHEFPAFRHGKNSIAGCYNNDKRKVRLSATEPECLHFLTRAVSLRHLERTH
jgi:hypothetical protein